MSRRLCVAQTKTPLLLAVATYTPFGESASAVIAPEHASSLNAPALLQSARAMLASSCVRVAT